MELMHIIQRAVDDKISGSTTVLNHLVEELRSNLDKDSDCIIPKILSDLNRVKESLPHFAVLHHFCNEFESIAKLGDMNCKDLQKFIDQYQKKWKDAGKRAAENMISEIDFHEKTVLLHSNSSGIFHLFKALFEKGIKPLVIQTVSSPVNEGKEQAKSLAKLGFNVYIINDALIAPFVKNSDFCVLGADRIFKGEFINKTGSMPISLACKHYQKPLYVISDSRKFFRNSHYNKPCDLEKPENPDEIWKNPPANIQVLNYYFEHIPNRLVNRYFFENGGYHLLD